MNLMTNNKHAKVQLVIPGVDRIKIRKLEQEINLEVLRRRASQGIISRGVNINLTELESKREKFIGKGITRSMVYDARKDVLEVMAARLTGQVQALYIHDNVPLEQKALALLAAIDDLFSPNPFPNTVQSAYQMLAEHLELALALDALIEQAA